MCFRVGGPLNLKQGDLGGNKTHGAIPFLHFYLNEKISLIHFCLNKGSL